MIALDGFECAGHAGMDNVSSMVLLRAAVRKLDVPLLACGGFADGASLAAALALGADGVAMGTRFMLTRESPLHPAIKQRMLEASERDSVQVGRSVGDPVRVLKNATAESILAIERSGAVDRHALHELVDARRWIRAFEAGTLDDGALPMGMCAGLIDDLPGCAELLEGMVRDATRAIAERLAIMVVAST